MKYPIERMQLIDAYHADDLKSMAANNTSAFNYRPVAGTNKLSNHSYGLAIDINPRINPYINSHKKLTPTNGAVYQCRDPKKCKGKYARYMIQKNSKITKIFKKYGLAGAVTGCIVKITSILNIRLSMFILLNIDIPLPYEQFPIH